MRAFSWSGGAHWAIGLTIALIFFKEPLINPFLDGAQGKS